MIMAPLRSRLLKTGIELGIFDLLEEFTPPKALADALGAHPGNTRRFLNALTTIGLLEKCEGKFRNGPDAGAFLVKTAPVYLGPFLQMVEEMCIAPLDHLTGMVIEGPNPEGADGDFRSESLWADVTRTSAAWVSGGAGVQMAEYVSALPEFAGFKRMLDLGGGHGMFALYFVDAHPTMTGVIFDRRAVVSVAEAFAADFGLQERISTQAGDYLKDDIGRGYDFIWACATLNFARHDLDTLFIKIAEALNPGGVFISFQDGLTHEQTQPDTMLGHLGHALQMGADLFFEQGEISDAMLRCGFRSVQSRTVEAPMGAMEMDIARK
jgi:SAM-dependent methyltransferase